MTQENNNLADIAKVMHKPMVLNNHESALLVGLPPDWTTSQHDLYEKLNGHPRRKVAKCAFHDTESFNAYIKRMSYSTTTIWCDADYEQGAVSFTSIINDHGTPTELPDFRDHTATFTPKKTVEWKNWAGSNGKPMNQVEFAVFIENNIDDIVQAENTPSGADMLQMSLNFESKQDMRLKSSIRLQNGGAEMVFVQDEDKNTQEKMQVFDKFCIGIPVFQGDKQAFPIHAKLRYRVREGKLTFWFDLIRADKVLRHATDQIIQQIRTETGRDFFFGKPF
jgi:uncharacterized protein YfdQ (DUF2303 family)